MLLARLLSSKKQKEKETKENSPFSTFFRRSLGGEERERERGRERALSIFFFFKIVSSIYKKGHQSTRKEEKTKPRTEIEARLRRRRRKGGRWNACASPPTSLALFHFAAAAPPSCCCPCPCCCGLSCHRCRACKAASMTQAPMVMGFREEEEEDLEEEEEAVIYYYYFFPQR